MLENNNVTKIIANKKRKKKQSHKTQYLRSSPKTFGLVHGRRPTVSLFFRKFVHHTTVKITFG